MGDVAARSEVCSRVELESFAISMVDEIGLTTKVEQWIIKILRRASIDAKGKKKKNDMYILDNSTMVTHASYYPVRQCKIRKRCGI